MQSDDGDASSPKLRFTGNGTTDTAYCPRIRFASLLTSPSGDIRRQMGNAICARMQARSAFATGSLEGKGTTHSTDESPERIE